MGRIRKPCLPLWCLKPSSVHLLLMAAFRNDVLPPLCAYSKCRHVKCLILAVNSAQSHREDNSDSGVICCVGIDRLAHTMRVPLHLGICATILAVFSPRLFLRFEERVTKPRGIPAASDDNSVRVVSRGFWSAVGIVFVACLFGWLVGLSLCHSAGSPNPRWTAVLQIIGAGTLLLATIYLRGSAIRTFDRDTLIERVDRWIYVAGYFLGTATIVVSLVWS